MHLGVSLPFLDLYSSNWPVLRFLSPGCCSPVVRDHQSSYCYRPRRTPYGASINTSVCLSVCLCTSTSRIPSEQCWKTCFSGPPETDSIRGGYEILLHAFVPKFHSPSHKNSSLICIFSHFNPLHTPMPYLNRYDKRVDLLF
jgi:hypothetical protein